MKIFKNDVYSVLLEGLKYYANEPQKLGRTFLRLVIVLIKIFNNELIYS